MIEQSFLSQVFNTEGLYGLYIGGRKIFYLGNVFFYGIDHAVRLMPQI